MTERGSGREVGRAVGASLTDDVVLEILEVGSEARAVSEARAGSGALAGSGGGSGRNAADSFRALVDAGLEFVVVGLDRDSARRIDPAVAAQALARLEPRLGVVVTADPSRDHPYNLARRVLALDHLTGGRAGLALVEDAPRGSRAETTEWSAGVTSGDVAEFAHLVATLWNTFPRGALVGDRDAGLFARSEEIVRPEHTGRWNVAGPLNSPSSIQGTPPVLWWGSPEGAALAGADLVASSELDLVGIDVGDLESARDRIRELAAPAVETGQADAFPTLRTILGLPSQSVDVSGLAPAFAAAVDPNGITA